MLSFFEYTYKLQEALI